MTNEIILLAGLPRTGSTLLLNILVQNPEFYAESNSGLCQIMWDAKVSCEQNAVEQLTANKRLEKTRDLLITKIPEIYYSEVSNRKIIDKCRPWIKSANIELARKYISEDVKSIVMIRPIDEIVKSIISLQKKDYNQENIFNDYYELIINSYQSTIDCLQKNRKNILIVEYKNLAEETEKTIKQIYKFINENYYHHNYSDVKSVISEDVSVYNSKNIHKIRPKIKIKNNDIKLSESLQKACDEMTNDIYSKLSEQK
jgi:sulfotransferase